MGDGLEPVKIEGTGSQGDSVEVAQESFADKMRKEFDRRPAEPPQDAKPANDGRTETKADGADQAPGSPERVATKPREFKSVIEADFNDVPNSQIGRLFYEAIKVENVPKGLIPDKVVPSHYVNDNGHFFFFMPKDGSTPIDKGDHYELNDGTKYPKGIFYYSQTAKQIEMTDTDGKVVASLNLTEGRKAADAAYQQREGHPHHAYDVYKTRYEAFASLEGKKSDTSNPVTYMNNLSKLADRGIDQNIESLRQMAEGNPNPYYKIYLADMLLAKAMLPIGRSIRENPVQALNDARFVQLNNPETMRLLDEAIRNLEDVSKESGDTLHSKGMRTPGNVLMPMYPWGYGNNDRDGYYRFWGGSLDQARHRELQLRFLKGFLQAMPTVELPGNLPARKY